MTAYDVTIPLYATVRVYGRTPKEAWDKAAELGIDELDYEDIYVGSPTHIKEADS